MSRKRKIDKNMIKKAYELSSKGFNNKQIYESLNISKSAFYDNMDLMDSIKKGKDELRLKLSNSLLNNAINLNNPTTQIFLAKRLRLFDDTFDSITLNKSDDVLISISNIFKAISNNDISQDKGKQLQSILDTFIKAYDQNILEKRVELLEDNKFN